MKPLSKAAILLFLIFSTFNSLAQVTEKIDELHHSENKTIMVAAHRGDWRNAPENSLQAYKLAIEEGVDIIEVDLNKTKDGVIVIMHDGTIDRTTDGTGKPSDYTLAELKKFHLKNGLGITTTHTVPTLQEVMTLAKGKVLVNLDKSYPYYNEAYKVLKETGTINQAIFKTDEHYETVRNKYHNLLDSITFMPVIWLNEAGAKQNIIDYQKAIKPVAFELIFDQDTSGIIHNNSFIKTQGSRIWINAMWASLNGGHTDDMAVEQNDTKDSWDWLIAHGATIIQTDRPKELLNYLRKKSLHK
jgi:glycerophosphoryl diester phosphodiesterase